LQSPDAAENQVETLLVEMATRNLFVATGLIEETEKSMEDLYQQ